MRGCDAASGPAPCTACAGTAGGRQAGGRGAGAAPRVPAGARSLRPAPVQRLLAGGRRQPSVSRSRRLAVAAGPRSAVTEVWWNKNVPDNMKAINSVQEFVDELADSGDNLVIADFYAKWCHACRSLFPKLCQICRDNPDIKLLKIDWDENKDVAKTLGVKVLPFFQLYRGAEGKVAEFSCSVAKVQRLRDAIEAHHAARCSLGLNPTLREFFPKVQPSHEMDRHEITILDASGSAVLSQSLALDEEPEPEREPEAVA